MGAACFEPVIIVPLKIQGKRHYNIRACPKFINAPDGLRDLLRLAAGPADEAGELDHPRLALSPACRGKVDSVSLAVARGGEPSGLRRTRGHLATVSSSR